MRPLPLVCVLVVLCSAMAAAAELIQPLGLSDVTIIGQIKQDTFEQEYLVSLGESEEQALSLKEEQAPSNVTNPSNATSTATASDEPPESEEKADDLKKKVTQALSASQSHTKVRSMLDAAKRAVQAAQASASRAMSLADTPDEKQRALKEVAVAKRLAASYKEQYNRYNPLADTGRESTTFGQMERDAEAKSIAKEQDAASQKYLSSLQSDTAEQKKRNIAYQQTVAAHKAQVAEKPPLLATKDPAMYTKDQVDALLEHAKEAKDKANAIELAKLNNEWHDKEAEAVHNAVSEVKLKADVNIKAANEHAEKKVAVAESKRRLAVQQAAFQIEKMKLTDVRRSAASAALTATLHAKVEAQKISQQADVQSAHEQFKAAMSSGIVTKQPEGYDNSYDGVIQGLEDFSKHRSVPKSANNSSVPKSANTSSIPSQNTHVSSTGDVDTVVVTDNSIPPPAGGPTNMASEEEGLMLATSHQKVAFSQLTQSTELQQKAIAAKQYAYKTHEQVVATSKQDAALPTTPLLSSYNEAKEQLANSESDEKQAKAASKSSMSFPAATILALSTVHAAATDVAARMKIQSDLATAESAKAVRLALDKTKEAFEKTAFAKAHVKQVQAERHTRGTRAAPATPVTPGAAQTAAVAALQKELKQVHAAAASKTAINLDSANVLSRQIELKTAQAALIKSESEERTTQAQSGGMHFTPPESYRRWHGVAGIGVEKANSHTQVNSIPQT